MTIRDDRKHSELGEWHRGWLTPGTPDVPRIRGPLAANHFGPDAVLYDCPDCGRAHFVTVDACPDAATAAKEVAMVDGRKAA